MSLRTFRPMFVAAACSLAVLAATPNFSGTWVLNNGKSKNLGMMASMADTITVQQTASELTVTDAATFNGNKMTRVTHYDLTGAAAKNDSPTGDPAQTTSRWQGAELVTLWETPGSIAGSTHKRTERRYLSPDGRTMYEVSESRSGDPKALVLVFERQ